MICKICFAVITENDFSVFRKEENIVPIVFEVRLCLKSLLGGKVFFSLKKYCGRLSKRTGRERRDERIYIGLIYTHLV